MTEPHEPTTEPHEPTAAPPPRRPTGAIVLGGVLAIVGLVWLLAAADAVPLAAQAAIGVLLVAVGLAHALLPSGAHHVLLVTTGVALALLGAAASALNLDLIDGGVGDRRYAPTELTELRHEYSLGIGSLGIDLTRLESDEEPAGELMLSATVGIGELVVAVPREASVHVDASVGIGEVNVRGQRRSGIDVHLQTEDAGAGEDDGGAVTAIRLLLEGGIGSVRVVDDDLGDAGDGAG
jgi:hypothetical protein